MSTWSKPVVKPEYIDGKYFKDCECGCGTNFEVSPVSVGQTRYAPGCRDWQRKKRMRDNYYKSQGGKFDPKKEKKCARCKVILPLERFPLASGHSKRRDHRIITCDDCLPFTIERKEKYLPDCGSPMEGIDFALTKDKCPLFANCRERINAGMWTPCEVPSRKELIFFLFSTDEEQEYLRSLIAWRFDENNHPIRDNIDRYLAHYYELGERILKYEKARK